LSAFTNGIVKSIVATGITVAKVGTVRDQELDGLKVSF
jgi:hypothetical protein